MISFDTVANILIVLDTVLFILLLVINVPKRYRYRQLFSALFASGLFVVGFYLYAELSHKGWLYDLLQHSAWFQSLFTELKETLYNLLVPFGIDTSVFKLLIWSALDTLILAIFVLLKLLLVLFMVVIAFFKKNHTLTWSAVAYEQKKDDIYIKDHMIYYSQLFLAAGIMAFSLLIASIFYDSIPHLLSLSFLLILETGLFLGGKHSYADAMELSVDPIGSTKLLDLQRLLKTYIALFKERIVIHGISHTEKQNIKNGRSAEEELTDAINNFVMGIEEDKVENLLINNAFCDQYINPLRLFFFQMYQRNYKVLVVACDRKRRDTLLEWFGTITTKELYHVGSCSNSLHVENNHVLIDTEIALINTITTMNSLEEYKVVLNLNTQQLIESDTRYFNLLLSIYRDKVGKYPSVFSFANVNHAYEESFNQLLMGSDDTHDIQLPVSHDKQELLYAVFRSEGVTQFQSYYEELNGREEYVGKEMALVYLAGKEGISNIGTMSSFSPLGEELEELKKPGIAGEYADFESIVNQFSMNVCITKDMQHFPLYVIYDNFHLLETYLKAKSFIHSEEVIVLIVSPPYALRDFFAHQLEAFEKKDLFDRFSPVGHMDDGEAAFILLYRLLYGQVQAKDIHLPRNKPVYKQSIVNFINSNLDMSLSVEQLAIEEESGSGSKVYALATTSEIKSLEEMTIVDRHHNILDTFSKNDAYLKYLPGMLIANNGKLYEIISIDFAGKNLIVNNIQTKQIPIYTIPILINHIVELNRGEKENADDLHKKIHNTDITLKQFHSGGIEQKITLENLNYELSINSYHEYKELQNPNQIFLHETWKKSFKETEILKVSYKVDHDVDDTLRAMIAYFVDEILKSQFTAQYHLVAVRVVLQEADSPYKVRMSCNDDLCLCFFDLTGENKRLLNSIYHHFDDLLRILYDYLKWVLENDPKEMTFPQKDGYDIVNLDKLKTLFKIISAITHPVRLGTKENVNQVDLDEGTRRQQCTFCWESKSTNDMERLDDGRIRCSTCKKGALETTADYSQLITDIKKYMKQKYDIEIVEEIKFKITDSNTLNQASRGVNDRLAVGFARSGDKYEIWAENGSPDFQIGEVLAHEMSHIWQYHNLNMEKLADDLVKIEGLAQWVGITYLEDHHPRLKHIVEAEKERSDEYGQGYRYVEDLLTKQRDSMSLIDRILRKRGRNPFLIYIEYFGK